MSGVVAGIVFIAALGIATIMVMSRDMKNVPGSRGAAIFVLMVGVVIAALIGASHWLLDVRW